jgi:hypothetical protein
LAEKDGRLKVNDRLLEINCQNVKYGVKEEALKIIAVSLKKKNIFELVEVRKFG